jgi:hypothetical protein
VLCYRLSTTATLVCSFGNDRVRFRKCMLPGARPDTPQLLFSYTNPHYRVTLQLHVFLAWYRFDLGLLSYITRTSPDH